jgi:hypothetical protein
MRFLSLKISLLIMGLSGITAQIVLLRELLVSFLGNELTLGVILANWLILVAIGSFLIGKSVDWVERKIEIFVIFQLIFSIAFPFTIYFCRIFKNTPCDTWRSSWFRSYMVLIACNPSPRNPSLWNPLHLWM